jgi:hypothetical protein
MVNVEVKVTEDDKLILTVDLKKVCGYTGGGNNVRIASSLGNLPIPTRDGRLRVERFNLNVYRPPTPREKAERAVTLEGWDDDED